MTVQPIRGNKLDQRDEITKEYFDESKVKIVDNTEGQFLAWFEGDLGRIARLSGAPADSVLTVDYLEEGGYKLSASNAILEEPMVRLILQDPEQEHPSLFITNSVFVLSKEHRRRKLGVRSLAIELLEAKKTEAFAYVEVFAIGNADTLNPDSETHQYSGYAVWPQLGFDGEIPQSLKEQRPELKPFEKVSQLLSTEGGLELWLKKGGDIWLRFYLHEASPSWVVLHRYMSHNGIKVTP
ncbi:hypothetical protein [Hydrogenophaga sp.]|uniref:hypothetical protein n=1 Tax=Hydrogenophaga sp. TaxID=1904254 RepID=UPI002731FAA4|nr:hypothetical protein [Hydrogenophaga sp.]MDP1684620.1 hypothetical protein [Hydrogenophaga sp.]